MGELLAFEPQKMALRLRRASASADAEIIIFPGVRYVRMTEPVKPKRVTRRPARRHPRPEKEKVS